MGAPEGVSLVTSDTPADDTWELSRGMASCTQPEDGSAQMSMMA